MQHQSAGGADRRRGTKEEEEKVHARTWDCGSPLYDSFELASLHRVLESHLMVLPFPGAAVSRSRRVDHRHPPGVAAAAGPDVTGSGAARRRRKAVGTSSSRRSSRKGWTGSKAAAAFHRAVTCWKSS